MVNTVILGDRDFVESYLPAVGEPLVITRASWRGAKALSIVDLATSYPPGAARSDVARDLARRARELAGLARPSVVVAELGSIEYTVLAPMLAAEWKPELVIVEVSRLHPASIAALKELSLLSHDIMIVGVYQRMAPRSRKIRPLLYSTALEAPRSPGFYSYKLKRLKSYIRAWLWYYEARDTVAEAREGGVPDYLLLDLEAKLSEAERLLKGSEYTLVYPSVYDIREPPPDELYRDAPLLVPASKYSLHYAKCYASIDVARSNLVTGCTDREDLSEEAIYLWLVRLSPVPAWRRELPGHLAETYTSYARESREAPYKLHPYPPERFLPGMDAPWSVIPLYSMDERGLHEIADMLLEDLTPLRVLASIAVECHDDLSCTEAAERAGQTIAEAVRQVVERLEEYKSLVSLYRSVKKILGEDWRLAPGKATREELQENLALLAWVLQASLGLDPEVADRLSLSSSEIAEILI